MKDYSERVQRLEDILRTVGCHVCRDWPATQWLKDDSLGGGPGPGEPDYPEFCPSCGRQGPPTIVITYVPAREVDHGR